MCLMQNCFFRWVVELLQKYEPNMTWWLLIFDQIYIWIVTQIFDWYRIHGIRIIFVFGVFQILCRKDSSPKKIIALWENLPGNEHVLSQGTFEDNFLLPRLVGYELVPWRVHPGKLTIFQPHKLVVFRVHFGSRGGIFSGATAGDVWRGFLYCFVHFLHLKFITLKKSNHPFGEYPPWN